MRIANLFKKEIGRPINGVVKADQLDERSVWQELDEFVVTREIDGHLRKIFDSYCDAIDNPNDPDISGKIGVWISGFFGSGKSHFLKVLAYLLANEEHSYEGQTKNVIEFFEEKISDAMLFGNIKRAVASNTDVILFNIDNKAEAGAEIAAPDVGVVTNVGPVHMERAGSIGAIGAAKAELVEALPADGLAVLNGDDPRVTVMARWTAARTLLFGLGEQCDVRGSDIETRGLDGISFTITHEGKSVRAECPLPGRHHVYPALAATAVALGDGLSLEEIAAALAEARVDLRLTVRTGVNGCTIIDDSYNASPDSMVAALDLLAELPGRRIAVLGHMRELGAAEEEGHRRVGRHTKGRCDALYVVGDDARVLAEEARAAGQDTTLFQSADEAAEALRKELREGDHVLVKASRAVGLESLVEALTGKPDGTSG
ncbi:MAG: hypothetical protein IH863_08555 [Chloroflexi bacterium]|nr:hypothetical protein [Chloroflexota bacterium]